MRTLIRLLAFLRPYRGRVILTALTAVGLMVCTVTLPYLTGRVIDDVLTGRQEDALTPIVIAVVVVGVVRFGLAFVRRYMAGWVSLAVEFDLRERMFGHLQRLSFAYFDRMPVGQLMSRATSDLQTVRFFLGYGLIFLFMHAFTLVLVSAILFWINPLLAALSLLIGPAMVAVAARSSRRSHPVLVDAQQKVGEMTQTAEESIVGVRVIKAFGQEDAQGERFAERSRAAFLRSMDANRLQAFYQPLMGFLPVLGLAVVLLVGGVLTIEGSMSLGEFVEFYLYLTLLMWPFRSIGMLVGNAQRAVASGQRIFEVLDATPDLDERPDARPLPAGGGHVRLEGVRFGYDPDRPVLDGFDLDIPAGRTIALIGATGSGKSTLTQLIPRYYDPQGGRVLLDGADVRDLRLDDLRRAVGMVSQEPFLFSATIRDNIAYGVPGAAEDAVLAAARLAQADPFIRALPEGYDTVVGERGYTLSGGQRQRLAIARAVVTDPRVLVLDEATASVDASTEREISDALRAVMAGRTTIIIAHRLSTIALADEIVLVDGGRPAARGTHDELYAMSALYREIHDQGLARPTDLVGREA
ncbi:MAG: ABC transporter ATP-binding protein/permease [Thermoleophilia bacterium]|nr:ABC transporter ATP-binding protein/permease [Thermoleophilia bacterium]